MRKKQLLKLNAELFERAEQSRLACEELKEENARLNSRIEELLSEKEELINQKTNEPLQNLEQKIIERTELCEPTKYGAQIIGKVVVAAAECCNSIATSGSADNKELINLILGRTEVAKAEVLKITENISDFEVAKTLMDSELSTACDYFESVKAQKL